MAILEPILSGSVIERLGWTLIHFIWEGACIGASLALILWLMPKWAARARYCAACLAMLLMLALPVITYRRIPDPRPRVDLFNTAEETKAAVAIPAGSLPSPAFLIGDAEAPSNHAQGLTVPASAASGTSKMEAALPMIVALWSLGVAMLSIRLTGGWFHSRRLRRRWIEPAGEELRLLLDDLKSRMKIGQAILLVHSATLSCPMVIGWIQPTILLPVNVIGTLTLKQIEALLAHELAHIRRHDFLINALQCVVETLLFYHPAVWWVSGQMRAERENCCDDIAVAACGGEAIEYARGLMALEENRAGDVLALSASGGALMRRIQRITRPRHHDACSPVRWISGVLIAGTGVLALSFAMLQGATLGSAANASVMPTLVRASDDDEENAENSLTVVNGKPFPLSTLVAMGLLKRTDDPQINQALIHSFNSEMALRRKHKAYAVEWNTVTTQTPEGLLRIAQAFEQRDPTGLKYVENVPDEPVRTNSRGEVILASGGSYRSKVTSDALSGNTFEILRDFDITEMSFANHEHRRLSPARDLPSGRIDTTSKPHSFGEGCEVYTLFAILLNPLDFSEDGTATFDVGEHLRPGMVTLRCTAFMNREQGVFWRFHFDPAKRLRTVCVEADWPDQTTGGRNITRSEIVYDDSGDPVSISCFGVQNGVLSDWAKLVVIDKMIPIERPRERDIAISFPPNAVIHNTKKFVEEAERRKRREAEKTALASFR